MRGGDRIGLIGLGLVGSALGERLRGAELEVTGYDIAAERRAEFAAGGGVVGETAREAVRGCMRVVLSLPTLKESAAVLREIVDELQGGTVVVDTTTGSAEESAALSLALAGRGIGYVECLIGGSSGQLREGETIALAGGTEQALGRCAEIFTACFRQVFPFEGVGQASKMKLVHNLVLGLNRAALAEGLALAKAAGLDAGIALEVLRAGASYSRVMDTKGRRMVRGEYEPEARLSQHLKDVRLMLEMGGQNGARMPLTELHKELLEEAERAGYGGADNSAIAKVYEREEGR